MLSLRVTGDRVAPDLNTLAVMSRKSDLVFIGPVHGIYRYLGKKNFLHESMDNLIFLKKLNSFLTLFLLKIAWALEHTPLVPCPKPALSVHRREHLARRSFFSMALCMLL